MTFHKARKPLLSNCLRVLIETNFQSVLSFLKGESHMPFPVCFENKDISVAIL